MINPPDSNKIPLDAFANQVMSHWQEVPKIFDSYTAQRQRFMVNRLRLLSKITLVVGLTVMFFFLSVIPNSEPKINAFKIGFIVEAFAFFCWFLCSKSIGRRYPHLIFLSLCWSITCTVQIDVALLFNHLEPRINDWMLMFVTQAAIVPVLWRIHLISYLGTIFCYFILYSCYLPTLNFPLEFYLEQAFYLFWTCIICAFSVFLYEKLRKDEFCARQDLEIAQEKSERLLLNILPEMIAEQLKQQQTTIADSFREVTVLFADIVGFTELSTHTSPPELVELLNKIFSIFDKLAEYHGVEKIKTIGDAYMAVAGLPIPRSDHAMAIANMALDMQQAIAQFNEDKNLSFHIRIGISTGPVVAGVIGLKKFTYDLWGDTVNTASRMESHGIAGCIQVCEDTYEKLKYKYLLEKRGVIKVKGKGEMTTYLLKGVGS
jgi:adenylate cyclase